MNNKSKLAGCVKKFDLTTAIGRNAVQSLLCVNPILNVGITLVKELFKSKDVEAQSQLAESLIKKGLEDGLEEMEIVLDNSKGGFNFSAPIEGVQISAGMSLPNDKIMLKVKYK